VYCAGGYRSSIAASLLQRSGFESVGEIAGGIVGWEAAKLPLQSAQGMAFYHKQDLR
jgi:hydroxyacylglutathione hydrolase